MPAFKCRAASRTNVGPALPLLSREGVRYVGTRLPLPVLVQSADLRCAGIMARMTATGTELLKGRHFDQQVIILCVRWYLS